MELNTVIYFLTASVLLTLAPGPDNMYLLAKSLAKKLNVPFAIADATTLTEAGYVGEDVENILLKLIKSGEELYILAMAFITISLFEFQISSMTENEFM